MIPKAIRSRSGCAGAVSKRIDFYQSLLMGAERIDGSSVSDFVCLGDSDLIECP